MTEVYYSRGWCENVCLFDPEVPSEISNLLADTGMCDVLSPLLGGPHSLTSETAAKTYSNSSSMYEPRSHYEPPTETSHSIRLWQGWSHRLRKLTELAIQMLFCAEKGRQGESGPFVPWSIKVHSWPSFWFGIRELGWIVFLVIHSCDSFTTIDNRRMPVGFPAGILYCIGQIQMDGQNGLGAIVTWWGGCPASAAHWDQLLQ